MYYIFPDIHGQYEKLEPMLRACGFTPYRGSWRNPHAKALFLGDFVDRGPENGKVLKTVRAMIDSGDALAVMGNHELNAIMYHTDSETGDGLRARNEKNTQQHASFLAEFPYGRAQTREQLDFLMTLPLALQLDGLRLVHACWDDTSLKTIERHLGGLILTQECLIDASNEHTELGAAVERVTKGPELALPEGYVVHDKEGTRRTRVRAKWWEKARTWHDIAMSVDNPDELPVGPARLDGLTLYPETADPVFFGHYWLKGAPVLQSSNALCLDYSAGLDGPLLVYHFDGGPLSLDNIRTPE